MGKRDPFLPTSRLIRAFYLRRQKFALGSADNSPPRSPTANVARRLGDLAGLINWILEQWARYLIQVRPYLQQGGVVVTDRYSFDFASRESWSLAHRPLVAGFMCRMFALPDRTYLLWEQPEVLEARKREGSVDEIADLLKRLRLITPHVPGVREIRTNTSVEATATAIATEIAKLLGARCRL